MALQQRRVHVGPSDWHHGAATDYWLNATGAANQVAAASAANPIGMSGWLWTTTSLTTVTGGTGDLNTSADVDPVAIGQDASTDVLSSPKIFGGYDQFQRVADVLGYAPAYLKMKFYARFSATFTETTAGWGLMTGTDFAAAGSAGGIVQDATNFRLRSAAGNDAGAAVDTAWHLFQINWTTSTTEWFIDGSSQGTITLDQDIWPNQFKMTSGVSGSRTRLSWLHIWYE